MAKQDELKLVAGNYATKYGFRTDDLQKGLEGFAVHLFAQEQGLDSVLGGAPTEEADLSDYILRRDDLGVDGALFDDAAKRIVLIQCTWRSNDRGVEDKLNAFASILTRLDDPDYLKQGAPQARELLGAIPQQVKDGYSVELRFVTNLRTRENDRLNRAVQAANRTFDKDKNRTTRLELYGAAEITQRRFELDAANAGSSVPEATFHIQRENILEWNGAGGGRKTMVGILKGNELRDLYKRYKNELFSANIRLPLITGKVNPEIRETAQEQPENFFYFNNGVSAVCKNLRVADTEVRATNLQIINGAQTVKALVDALDESPQRELYVLFRLTETEEGYGGEFTENVIRYNNTQNPVKVSDFFSNDPIQLWLSKNLTELSGKGPLHPFYYVHKSGFAPNKTQGLRKLTIEDFARTRYAFLFGPTISYREPATFFDRRGRYNDAFGVGDDRKMLSSWDQETLFEAAAAVAINERIQNISKQMKKDERRKTLPEARYLFRLSRYIMALVAVGLRETKNETFIEYATLMSTDKTFAKFVNPMLKIARDNVRREMLSLSEKYVQPEYNFARDDVAWERMQTLMISSVLEATLDDEDY